MTSDDRDDYAYDAADAAARRRPTFADPAARCTVPPPGWVCTRTPGHPGPCAAWPASRVDVGEALPWATLWQYLTGRQCRARRDPNPSGMWGRCELAAGHPGDHALERGFDTPRWSTDWTDVG